MSVAIRRLALAAIAVMTVVTGMTAAAPRVTFSDTKLKNGLRVIISEDHSAPVFSIAINYNAGSRDERKGRTGFAHLFEHMMFKGTPTLGTKDYPKDLAIIDSQEKLRDEIRKEEATMRAAYRRGDIDDLLKPACSSNRRPL
jgi:predicted Zn-dependent peptidase